MCTRDEIPMHVDIRNRSKYIEIEVLALDVGQ